MIESISHIGIAVRDLERAISLYENLLGRSMDTLEKNPDEGHNIAFFKLDEISIELISPTRSDSAVARFLEKRGEGIHHIAFRTDDIEKELARVESLGIRLVNRETKAGSQNTRIAFIHPKDFGGVLVELVQ
jgi:methylmalonyl-CoA/ethylmalonyl-CoA epimerase